MNVLPTFADIAATAQDQRFFIAVAIAILAGLARGFSGFGSALIYIPLISALYEPRIAAASLLLIDTVFSAPFAIQARAHCNWREIAPVTVGALIGLPLGVAALTFVNPLALRWLIAFLVFAALAALVAGWRYRGRPTSIAAAFTGMLSGIGAGAAQIGAPPLLVFWLGGTNSAATIRANIMVFFLFQGVLSMIAYAYGGVFTPQTLSLSLLLSLPFAVPLGIGARWFLGSSDELYRRVAYVVITIAAFVSLPLFDALR
jgi:uncharacterized protein